MKIFSTDKQVLDAADKLSGVLISDDVELVSAATTAVPRPIVVHALPRCLVGDSDIIWHEMYDDSVQMVDRISGGLSPAGLGNNELIRYLTQLRGNNFFPVVRFFP